MLRRSLLVAARSERLKNLATTTPISSGIVTRFVPGETAASAVDAARRLVSDGLLVSLDHLGEDTLERAQADAGVKAYVDVLDALGEAGLAPYVEVSVKLSAVGQALPRDGEHIALEHARTICQTAREAGTMVTLDMEDHTTTDSTLEILRSLRQDFPDTGAVLQAYLYRTVSDCEDLAYEGSRVRLCKGAYKEPESVAFQAKGDVDMSYVRCLKVLMAGRGYPMVATHDPRLVEIAGELARRFGREKGGYEFQMLYGVRPDEQRRLARDSERVRVYVPYGTEWYAYLMRRLAERPANLGFFLRSLVTRN